MIDDIVIIAITGGFASGKTTVANYIQQQGFPVIFTDLLAKKVIEEVDQVRFNLLNEFGNDAFNSDGSLNSNFISELVFADNDNSKRKLNTLNQIVHPAVIDLMINTIEDLAYKGIKLIFVESALIFEAHLEKGFDYIIVVESTEKNQITRAIERTHLTENQVINRINCQISLTEKSKNADFVLKNNSSIEELHKSISTLLPILTYLKCKRLANESE